MDSNSNLLSNDFFNILIRMVTEINKKVTPDQLATILKYSRQCSLLCSDSVLNSLNNKDNIGNHWSEIKSELINQN